MNRPFSPREQTKQCSSILCVGNYRGWRLDKLDQHSLSTQGFLRVSFGMYEGDIVTACALSDPSGREAHSLLGKPFHALRKRVYPQSDVIQGRDMNSAHSDGATGMCTRPGAVDTCRWYV